MTNNAENDASGNSPLESNIRYIITTLVIVFLGWNAYTITQCTLQNTSLTTQFIDLKESFKATEIRLEAEIQKAQGNTQDRYTSYDAEKDFRTRDAQIIHNTNEIEGVNKRIEAIEIQMRRK